MNGLTIDSALISKILVGATALVFVLMVTTSGMQIFDFYSTISKLSDIENTNEGKTTNNSKDTEAIDASNSNIASLNLFGEPDKKPEIPQIQDIPETQLKLTLRGTFSSEDPTLTSAVIEGPDRKAKTYNIDDELPGNATLESVHADRIVLNRSGRLETLFFPKRQSSKGSNGLLRQASSSRKKATQKTPNINMKTRIGRNNDGLSLKERLRQKREQAKLNK